MSGSVRHGLLQRRCACGQHMIGGEECEECRKRDITLQRRAIDQAEPTDAPPIVYDVIRSPGQALDSATRSFFEPRFGHDFSRVRVHIDSRASESARAVNAHAYTVGPDIVFGYGQYAPGQAAGASLLAHELTHIVQQTGQAPPYSELRIGPAYDEGEIEAENVAAAFGRGTWSRGQVVECAGVPGLLRRAAIYTGRILDEGTCADLVAGSKYICCDPDNGLERTGKKQDIDGAACPSEKFTPTFTCDNKCSTAVRKGCADDDNWMALPKSRFASHKCNQDLVICANGKSTQAYVRDRSDKQAWEVSRAIPAALGVKPDFRGAIYGDEKDPEFKKDKRCGAASGASESAPAARPAAAPAPTSAGPSAGPYVGDKNEPIPE